MKYVPLLLFIITEACMLAIVIIIFTDDNYEFLEKIAMSFISIIIFNFLLLFTYLLISYVGEQRIKQKNKQCDKDKSS
tara:strand:+ start:171 stop:404 length:234 start_codon:yes stop_codon:yes gene_type:complete